MATVAGTVYLNGCNYQLQYDVLSQSVANNTSTVRLYGVLNVTNNYISWTRGTASVHTESGGIGTYYSKGSYTLIQRDFTWSHDSAGNFSNVGIGFGLSTTFVSGSGMAYITLPHINRISSINSFTGSDIEGKFKATYTKYVSSYTCRLRISIPNVKELMVVSNYASGTEVSLDDTAIADLKSHMNTNKISAVTIKGEIDTYNGSTYLGRSSAININVSFVDANPTYTYTIAETNAKVSAIMGTAASSLIENVSQPKFTITPSAKKGATIDSVSIIHNGQTFTKTASPYEFTITAFSGTFEVVVTDVRGLKNTTGNTITKTLIAYKPVSQNSLSIVRPAPTSNNVKFDLDYVFYNKKFNNTQNTISITYKLNGGTATALTGYTIDSSNTKVTLSKTVNNLISYQTTGTIELTVSDKFSSFTDSVDVLKGIPTVEIGENDFQVNGNLYIADTLGQNPKLVEPSSLVAEYTMTADGVLNKTFDVDMVEDGCIYDIYLYGRSAQAQMICMEANGLPKNHATVKRFYVPGSGTPAHVGYGGGDGEHARAISRVDVDSFEAKVTVVYHPEIKRMSWIGHDYTFYSSAYLDWWGGYQNLTASTNPYPDTVKKLRFFTNFGYTMKAGTTIKIYKRV